MRQTPHFRFFPSLCTGGRFRPSPCRRCIDACPAGILDKGAGGITVVDFHPCLGCGLCATLCPVGVFEMKNPSDQDLLAKVKKSLRKAPQVAFCCFKSSALARIPAAVEISCLGRLNEAVLIGTAVLGAKTIWLNTGFCSPCEIRKGLETAARTVLEAENILDIYQHPARLILDPHCPPPFGEPSTGGVEGEGKTPRREFLKMVAREITAGFLSLAADASNKYERLAPGKKSAGSRQLPTRVPTKRRLLNHFVGKLGKPRQEKVPADKLPFRQVTIGHSCTMCGWCSLFCPTQALLQEETGEVTTLSFDTSRCVRCDLCIGVCQEGALTVEAEVETKRLSAAREPLLALSTYKCQVCSMSFGSAVPEALCRYCKRKKTLFDTRVDQ